MNHPIQLIVGLGNPGAEYANTRHNAGAWFVSHLASIANVSLRSESKFHGQMAQALLGRHECKLLIPTTYMNLSGQAVAALAKFYKISPAAILVAHDELDLPVGVARLKLGGGDGGHNGLKDTTQKLGTAQYLRLRLGIGRPGPTQHGSVADYVLHTPSKAEHAAITEAIEAATTVLPQVLQGHLNEAMKKLHTDKSTELTRKPSM